MAQTVQLTGDRKMIVSIQAGVAPIIGTEREDLLVIGVMASDEGKFSLKYYSISEAGEVVEQQALLEESLEVLENLGSGNFTGIKELDLDRAVLSLVMTGSLVIGTQDFTGFVNAYGTQLAANMPITGTIEALALKVLSEVIEIGAEAGGKA